MPVFSKVVPSVIASSVCWSLQCLVSTLTQRGRWTTLFFFLGSLVQSRCGEGGTLLTNNTGVCSQCLSHTGPPPAHGTCSLPAHTAQALGCSAGNHLWPALGCLHLPGPSHSCSGTRVVLRGTDSVGPAFCALPRSEQLRQERQDIYLFFNNEVFGERSCCDLSPPRHSVIWVYNRRTFSGRC